jgi:DNA-binding NarL/FixJ family response regulator
MPASIRLLVVDDHRLLREGLNRIIGLQPDMAVVAEAANGQEAVEQFKRHNPDVTLMDLQLPIASGLEAIRAIRAARARGANRRPDDVSGDEDIHRAFQAGAMGISEGRRA